VRPPSPPEPPLEKPCEDTLPPPLDDDPPDDEEPLEEGAEPLPVRAVEVLSASRARTRV
jgi:hypothetical protein